MAQKNKWLQRTLLASALMMAGPLSSTSAAVVTSIRPVGFIAAAIADGVTPTEVLLPDGASPHDFALRPSDIQRLRAADLVVWVGPDMEAFLAKPLISISANRQVAISELSGVKPLLMKGEDDDHDHEHDHDHAADTHNNAGSDEGDGHHHGEYNMHVWLSPEVAKVTAIAIHDRLLELMPQNKDKLDANLRQFENLLTQTDKNVGNMLKPVQGKGYYVFHDAYGYFEKHFGLSPLGPFYR
ncbi:High-affinity zinc uptake system protein znuA precursor [Serratia quinivorans]|uniref:High-affinity zinc uptake system protein ZnuA n=1 Tax=Serratia quinivorans TaxID=137545 RepID=A0A380ASP5_9GAMM|nr:High-affinity zinc uptake system protein znuA precursor [Serratia quinivorans]